MSDIVSYLADHAALILGGLVAVNVAAATLARFTKTTADDAIVARIQSALERLGSLFVKPGSR